MIDELQREYAEVRDLISALQQRLVRLPVSPEWSSSLQRLVRELADQVEHATETRRPVEEPHRFRTRPPRLR
ncbi:hypothetical protein [Saccharopolyspora rosea]|uniref:Uncharacterized protein n=1 Tax=Saccharopolyspora rosea TaxID=524884 RepID=A0ABW3FJV3_9PSEU|nr:hypothetical protein [Saccharopolyspora rosea]